MRASWFLTCASKLPACLVVRCLHICFIVHCLHTGQHSDCLCLASIPHGPLKLASTHGVHTPHDPMHAACLPTGRCMCCGSCKKGCAGRMAAHMWRACLLDDLAARAADPVAGGARGRGCAHLCRLPQGLHPSHVCARLRGHQGPAGRPARCACYKPTCGTPLLWEQHTMPCRL